MKPAPQTQTPKRQQAASTILYSALSIFYILLSQWEFLTWEIRVAFPKENQLQQTLINKVHAMGLFVFSIVHRTLRAIEGHRCVIACYGVSRCVTLCQGVLWSVKLCHGVPWYPMACHGVSYSVAGRRPRLGGKPYVHGMYGCAVSRRVKVFQGVSCRVLLGSWPGLKCVHGM